MAALATETNTFSALPTGWSAFREGGLKQGDASADPDSSLGVLLAEWRGLAEADQMSVIEGTAAAAQPAGRTLRHVYEALRDRILGEIAAALPLDIVLLNLHGAMVAEGYNDCEGDLLARVRALVGPSTVVGAELDLHCNMTAAMFDNADVLIAYKEYPHTDEIARGRELYALCRSAALKEIKPTTAVFDCKMISMWRTTEAPTREFVDRLKALEGRDGVLSISFGHGFAWSDVSGAGAKVWVITDGDAGHAERLARELGQEIYRLREATRPSALTVEAALDRALAVEGLSVLADVADNPGGGAASDSTFILEALLARGVTRAVVGCLWDPGAVQICREAGVGAALPLRIGGKLGPTSGRPVDVVATVRAVSEAHHQTGLSGEQVSMGGAVWIEAAGIDIVLNSRREQVFSPDVFTNLGLALAERRIAVVKSTQHFHAAFAPLAEQVIYVDTPGAISPDFAAIPYADGRRDFWPATPDPLGLG
jgi:microcystin degradation protein MlrC